MRMMMCGRSISRCSRDEIIAISNSRNVHKLGLLQQMAAEWDAWRYVWDMDLARELTSTGRWKSTQEMKIAGK